MRNSSADQGTSKKEELTESQAQAVTKAQIRKDDEPTIDRQGLQRGSKIDVKLISKKDNKRHSHDENHHRHHRERGHGTHGHSKDERKARSNLECKFMCCQKLRINDTEDGQTPLLNANQLCKENSSGLGTHKRAPVSGKCASQGIQHNEIANTGTQSIDCEDFGIQFEAPDTGKSNLTPRTHGTLYRFKTGFYKSSMPPQPFYPYYTPVPPPIAATPQQCPPPRPPRKATKDSNHHRNISNSQSERLKAQQTNSNWTQQTRVSRSADDCKTEILQEESCDCIDVDGKSKNVTLGKSNNSSIEDIQSVNRIKHTPIDRSQQECQDPWLLFRKSRQAASNKINKRKVQVKNFKRSA
ncbi:unnamed protein product [Allacma fusca]|uniref:Uncharacterized protein n=1 Tax=Allacma fusca TaxID=39272 RepID=A0A8J2L5J2_9HEXA|nr:unnamed protein product [Allacma fusca]